jgi:tryptophan-rich sensory protein
VSPLQSVLGLAGFLVLCFAVAFGGAALTALGGEDWYANLEKPPFNPPNELFGPIWLTLYAVMAVAAWLVWRRRGWSGARKPLTLFLVQLALNLAWSALFFGMHEPGLALLEIVLLWVAIFATMWTFEPVSKPAAYILGPYLLWVTFAGVLNYAIWRLNY